MGTSSYSDAFKRDAVHRITVLGYPIREVSRRLGVSTHSLCKWSKLFGNSVTKPDMDHGAESRRLKRALARVTEERDILKIGCHCRAMDGVDGSRSRHRNVPHRVLSS